MDNKLEITQYLQEFKMINPVIVKFLALISLITSGCDEIPAENSKDIELTENIQAICSPPIYAQSEGNDMQGPDRILAKRFCSDTAKYAVGTPIWNACIKMYTAQYYGDKNVSYTFHGTWIKWADEASLGSGPQPHYQRLDTPLSADVHLRNFEAIWGENGALCVRTPRWGSLYYYNSVPRLRDCTTDPKDRSIPWSGNPFAGTGANKGLIITYTQDEKSVIDIVKDSNGNVLPFSLAGSGTYLEVGSFLTWGMVHPVYNICGNDYVEDDRFVAIVPWRYCSDGTSICQYIMTSSDLDNPSVKDSYYIISSFKKVYPPPYSFPPYSYTHYVLKARAPGTVELATWALDLGGRPYRYVTATRDIIDRLCLAGSCVPYFIKTEGYVYQVKTSNLM